MILSNSLNILIDADVVAFRGSLAGETVTDWGEGNITTELDLGKATANVDRSIRSIVRTVKKYMEFTKKPNVIMAFSDKVNFRKTLYPLYKANRTKPKPQLYKSTRQHIEANYQCKTLPTLEGDDVLGILATSMENAVVCSIDKDMATIPNTVFFNFDNHKQTFEHTTPEKAQYFHYFQCLIGDTADNYKGCPGIGKVKAKKALDEECSWEQVVKLYESKGQTEEEALLMARVAKILTKEYYVGGKIRLWTPMSERGTSRNDEEAA
jgi:DNA polymerase I